MDPNLPELVANLSPEQLVSPAGRALARRLIRDNLEAWCRFALHDRGETPAAHHKLILSHLQDVSEGRLHNLILLMPPGSAKSTYTSVLYPPWHLNKHPRDLILACSYSYTLIEGFGKACRDLVENKGEILGLTMDKERRAAGDWRLTTSGGYFCAGVGAGISGHRADLAFIDDYLGNEQDANSEVIREAQWNWYLRDFSTRLKPNASKIIIANRRHEEDLVGKILAKEGSKWTVISLPMEAEDNDPLGRKPGEWLWAEWFAQNEEARQKILAFKADPLTWSGLFQQHPTPVEGAYFKKEMLCTYRMKDQPPIENLRIYIASDHALKKSERNDYTCFIVAGVDHNSRIWILDIFRSRLDTYEAVQEMLRYAKRYSPVCWWAGKDNIAGSIEPFLLVEERERNIYIPIEQLSDVQDKERKAQSIKARMTAKMVMFPEESPEWSGVKQELLTFPNGSHDDCIDALANLGRGLAQLTPGSVTPPQPEVEKMLSQPLTGKWLMNAARRAERREQELIYN